jgi:hypothetical protein
MQAANGGAHHSAKSLGQRQFELSGPYRSGRD